jgi:hypothetical protein
LAEQHEGHRDVRLEFSRGRPKQLFFLFPNKRKKKKRNFFRKSGGTRLGVNK